MNKKNTNYKLEIFFCNKQTLKELLIEMLVEKISTLDCEIQPI